MPKMKRILVFILALVVSFWTFACDGIGGEENLNDKYFDAITKTLTLSKVYEGKSFLNDGIGPATLVDFIDGDTTRLRLENGEVITIRYYEIDTPESTGNVEKWGKAASKFVKDRLSEATEIVLEATGDRATHDSYGTRYLGYLWYKTANYDKFKCLNLELTENGFTDNKGIDTSDYPYYSYFKKANDFARSKKLRLYSSADDPLYSTDPVEMTLKEFHQNRDLFYNSDTDSGAKVKVRLTLTNLYVSSSGTYTFTGTEYDKETGETYTINVYAGYQSSPASDMKIGHLYDVIGNIQNYYGTFQISGVLYDTILDGEGFTKIVQRNYYLTFNSTINYRINFSTSLYGDVTVLSVSEEGGVLTFTGSAHQTQKAGPAEEAVTFTFKLKNATGAAISVGDVLSLNGYQFEKDSKIIDVVEYTKK